MLHRGSAAALAFALLFCFHHTLPSSQQDRAADILARARELIGGEARLNAVHSLAASGKMLREGASRVLATAESVVPLNHFQQRYTVEMKVLLPDKFVLWAVEFGTEDGFSGTELIAKARGEPRRMTGAPDARQRFAELRHREFLRYMLAFLLDGPPQDEVRFADGGVASVDGVPADVVEATGKFGLAVWLYFDRQGRLLALKDRVARPRRAEAPVPKASEGQPVPLFRSLEAAPVDDVRGVQIGLADYRTDDGISLPHLVTIVRDGYDRQRWEIKKFKVNPKIKPKEFAAR